MSTIKVIVDIVFEFGLLINAILFIPQAVKVYHHKSAEGLSLLTFIGFNFIQLFFVLHALLQHDLQLLIGMSASFITCGSVTFGIIFYRNKL